MSIDHRIAIVGVSAIMPGAPDVDAFWRAVIEGRDQLTDIPTDRWLVDDYHDPDPEAPDKTYARRGAFLPEVELDPMAFGVPPRMLPATDSAQLLALVVADRLLAGLSGAGLGRHDRERVGVFLGSASLALLGEMAIRTGRPMWRRALLDSGLSETDADAVCDRIADYTTPWQEATFPGLLSNVVAGRIAHRFDLHGANFTVDAACASSLAALSIAVDDLLLGRSDLAIAGGVDTLSDPMTFLCFSKTPALSPTGDCRPFAHDADGTMLGEGIAMFALKRLADAERDGDGVYAVIRGIGSSSDGSGTSIYAPLETGQARALRRAYAAAAYGPDTVGLVEAHGTGTVAGDAAEVAALRAVFAEPGRADTGWCALGSVKSQIGHTKAAAGAAGLLKAVLALRHRVLPPTIKVEQPNAALGLDGSPFYLNTVARPWLHTADHPRRASVSSFGFGGSNFHVTLEEHTTRSPARCAARPDELVVLSAGTPRELFGTDLSGGLHAVARHSHETFRHSDPFRLAVVASSSDDLAHKLDQARGLVGEQPFSTPTGVHYGVGKPSAGRIAFLFPGQGTQRIGMGGELALHFPQAHAVWNRHHRVADVVFAAPVFTDEQRQAQHETLTDTRWAQPAIAAHSLALLAVLDAVGVRPDCVAGHSFGELIAWHAAGAIDRGVLLRLAARRGELMRDAGGVMLALETTREQVAHLLDRHGISDAWIANHNAPRQVVVSATEAAAALLDKHAAEDEITVRRLDTTAAAFHSPLVAASAAGLVEFLAGEVVRAPLLDVYGNATAAVHPVQPASVRRAMADHLAAGVRFADMIEAMHADGVRTFIEVGPSATLTRLVAQILGDAPHEAIALDRPGRHEVTGLHDALARLAVLGTPLAFGGLWSEHAPVASVGPRPALTVSIGGGNHGRRYPPNPHHAPTAPAPVLSVAATGNAATAPRTTPAVVDDEVLRAVLAAQRETAQAHAAYLGMAERTADVMMALSATAAPPVTTAGSSHLAEPSPRPQPEPPPRPTAVPETVTAPLAIPTAEPPSGSAVVPAGLAGPVATGDLEELVLAAIAEKTGYPVETLAPHMELEADLGLDSITRAQVLAALPPLLPQLENVDRAKLTPLLALRTVGEIADQLRALLADAAHDPEPPGTDDRTVRRHVVRLTPSPATGEPMVGLHAGPLVVTPDGAGVAEEVVRLLLERGVSAEVSTVVDTAASVLSLGGLAEAPTVDDAMAAQREAFRVAHTIAPRISRGGGVFVTVQDTGGFGYREPRTDRAWLGGLAALARTARREWSSATVKAIDCERATRSATEIAAVLVDELTRGGPELDVALAADGTRWGLQADEVPDLAHDGATGHGLDDDAVIVVSGGTGEITTAALRTLASRCRARFVLLGRRPEPPRLVSEAEQCHYVPVDVRDETAVHTALATVRERCGPITGIVHAAGVLADKHLADKTTDQFDLVFGTKVEGLQALLAATAADPLRLICAFSSVVALTGNAGQCDYAMANETLNHVIAAEQRRRPEAVARVLLWGPWDGGMVTPELAEVFRLGGIDLISPAEGALAFAREIETPASEPRVVLTAGQALDRLWEPRRG